MNQIMKAIKKPITTSGITTAMPIVEPVERPTWALELLLGGSVVVGVVVDVRVKVEAGPVLSTEKVALNVGVDRLLDGVDELDDELKE